MHHHSYRPKGKWGNHLKSWTDNHEPPPHLPTTQQWLERRICFEMSDIYTFCVHGNVQGPGKGQRGTEEKERNEEGG